MSTVFKIAVVPWVCRTAQHMEINNKEDVGTWNRVWFDHYQLLGGESKATGNKGCIRAAARGLWMLGRIRTSKRPLLTLEISTVTEQLTKNAAYAAIAADLLQSGASPRLPILWPIVQSEFRRLTDQMPATSEQGEIRMVIGLHQGGVLN